MKEEKLNKPRETVMRVRHHEKKEEKEQKEAIVRLRVNPPYSDDPTLMEDMYLDTATLELMYAPPLSLTGEVPALSNLSGQT